MISIHFYNQSIPVFILYLKPVFTTSSQSIAFDKMISTLELIVYIFSDLPTFLFHFHTNFHFSLLFSETDVFLAFAVF